MALKNTIFYSWQSDLPNKTNRAFIEGCLKAVVKELGELGPFSVELNLDRDTMNSPGTPSIVDSIFQKIEQAKMFVADISIINPGAEKRKTPNPNVLIELGYAARALGWEKVICVYNMDQGSYDDLPFDLKQRRPLGYSLEGKVKADVQRSMVKTIVANIRLLHQTGQLFDTVSDFLKMQVDTEMLTIVSYLKKIFLGYETANSLKSDVEVLNLDDEKIRGKLKSDTFLGFQVFKKLHEIERKLTAIVNHAMASPHHGKEVSAMLIDMIAWVGRFDRFNSLRTQPEVFQKVNEEIAVGYKAVRGTDINPNNQGLPDRFILMQTVDDQRSIVRDFGDFVESPKIEGLLHYYRINPAQLENYVQLVRDFIKLTERWLDMTNGEFIIDNIKMFEIHPLRS